MSEVIGVTAYMKKLLDESIRAKNIFFDDHQNDFLRIAMVLRNSFDKGNKVLIFGNGGSAADAQHMAAEMIGRLKKERQGLPAIALTTDSSNLTAIGNDYGYDMIFKRQIQALAKKGDIVFAISTSGNSKNVINAVEEAILHGCFVIGMTGNTGGRLKEICNICLNVRASSDTGRIQESHIFAIHTIIDILDEYFIQKS